MTPPIIRSLSIDWWVEARSSAGKRLWIVGFNGTTGEDAQALAIKWARGCGYPALTSADVLSTWKATGVSKTKAEAPA